jgi:hypothetical protein
MEPKNGPPAEGAAGKIVLKVKIASAATNTPER